MDWGWKCEEIGSNQGFSIALGGDLMMGSSQPRRAVSSRRLTKIHFDGTSLEIRNTKWGMSRTPQDDSEQDAMIMMQSSKL
jgi:hypothetical protein